MSLFPGPFLPPSYAFNDADHSNDPPVISPALEAIEDLFDLHGVQTTRYRCNHHKGLVVDLLAITSEGTACCYIHDAEAPLVSVYFAHHDKPLERINKLPAEDAVAYTLKFLDQFEGVTSPRVIKKARQIGRSTLGMGIGNPKAIARLILKP